MGLRMADKIEDDDKNPFSGGFRGREGAWPYGMPRDACNNRSRAASPRGTQPAHED